MYHLKRFYLYLVHPLIIRTTQYLDFYVDLLPIHLLHHLQKSVALAFDKTFFYSDKALDFAVIGLKNHGVSGFYGVEDLRHANIQPLVLGRPVSFKESDLLACYQVIVGNLRMKHARSAYFVNKYAKNKIVLNHCFVS